jgi:putative ABC transport system permease protein
MMEMTAMFAGILNRAFSPVTNIGAAMWIMDPAVNTATSPIPMPGYVLDAARSMDGVSYAVPLFMGGAMVKLANGTYQGVNVVGLDDSSLFGRPELEQGNIQDIYADNTFLWCMTPNSPSWEIRRLARPSNSMIIVAGLWASPGSPPMG